MNDVGARIEEIVRNGGELWAMEIRNPVAEDDSWRPWSRQVEEEAARSELAAERSRRPDLEWRTRHIVVESTVTGW